jgi:DNA-binding beta-propeller fold protein YncE
MAYTPLEAEELLKNFRTTRKESILSRSSNMTIHSFTASGRSRGILLLLALLVAAVSARAQAKIRSFTGVIEGHAVGGITTDLVGNIYVADFGDVVWKITPEGERHVFASGLYGASGNAIDNEGNLLQSNFYGNSITKIDRNGHAKPFVTSGVSGPVGIAVNRQTGDIYVTNCRDNSIARVATDGAVSSFAKSDLFNCPNGISFDREGNLYVVNYRDNKMLKIDPKGLVRPFTTVSEKGLGHLCFKDDRFYVTAHESHEIYEVALDGTAKRILGSGERGIVDGRGAKAQLSFPNGIASSPWGERLYINEYVNDSISSLPRRTIIREIVLEPDGVRSHN